MGHIIVRDTVYIMSYIVGSQDNNSNSNEDGATEEMMEASDGSFSAGKVAARRLL